MHALRIGEPTQDREQTGQQNRTEKARRNLLQPCTAMGGAFLEREIESTLGASRVSRSASPKGTVRGGSLGMKRFCTLCTYELSSKCRSFAKFLT